MKGYNMFKNDLINDFEKFVCVRLENRSADENYDKSHEKLEKIRSNLSEDVNDIVNEIIEIETEIIAEKEETAYKSGFFDALKLLYCV